MLFPKFPDLFEPDGRTSARAMYECYPRGCRANFVSSIVKQAVHPSKLTMSIKPFFIESIQPKCVYIRSIP